MELKKIYQNESGSLTLITIPLIVCGFLIVTLNYKNSYIRMLDNKVKFRQLLCSKSLNLSVKNYVNNVIIKDQLIRLSLGASLVPAPPISIPAKTAIRALKLLQLTDHFLYLKKVANNKYCTQAQKIPYFSSPFKLGFKGFSRYFDQTTKLKSRKWKKIIYSAGHSKSLMTNIFHVKGIRANYQSQFYSTEALLP